MNITYPYWTNQGYPVNPAKIGRFVAESVLTCTNVFCWFAHTYIVDMLTFNIFFESMNKGHSYHIWLLSFEVVMYWSYQICIHLEGILQNQCLHAPTGSIDLHIHMWRGWRSICSLNLWTFILTFTAFSMIWSLSFEVVTYESYQKIFPHFRFIQISYMLPKCLNACI